MARRVYPEPPEDEVHRARWELLENLDAIIDPPLIVLSFLWLALLVLEFTVGLDGQLEITVYVLWGLFVLDFALEFVLAPDKLLYLRRNWLTAIALVVPAFRVLRVVRALRVLRAARAARTLSLARLVTSANRGMRTLRAVIGGAQVVFVVVLTLIVTFLGSAGMYFLERSADSPGFQTYGDSLWWTAMAITTIGSGDWPVTLEGRILGWLLAFYALAIFGYITATFASLLLGAVRDDEVEKPAALSDEIAALRGEIASLREQLGRADEPG